MELVSSYVLKQKCDHEASYLMKECIGISESRYHWISQSRFYNLRVHSW